MFGFLIGWGVFWLLLWLAVFWGLKRTQGQAADGDEILLGGAAIGVVVSAIYLIAVVVGGLLA